MDAHVHLRNIQAGEGTRYRPEVWLTDYSAFIEDSLCTWRDTLGGSIGITGTPEQGRLTVCDAEGEVVRDYDWRTVVSETSVSQAARRWS